MQFNPATIEQDARSILYEWVQSDSLRKHCEAVSTSMRHFAHKLGENESEWAAIGLIHDFDYEQHPVPDPETQQGHPFTGVAWLREQGWPEEYTRAILSHADYSGVERITPLERTLYAVDELSGFATAVALVRPSKSIHDVDVRAVRKKMKDKAFAAKVNRQDIINGAEELGRPLDDVIAEVLAALQGAADRLGLNGTAAP